MTDQKTTSRDRAQRQSGDPRNRLEQRAANSAASGDDKRAADTLGHLATLQLEAGKLGEAVQTFERALEFDGTRADLYRELAKTHHQLGRFDQAFDAYAAAAELYRADDELDTAMELLVKMTRLDPDEVLRHAKLSELLVKLGKQERALEQLESCSDKLLNEQEDLEGFLEMSRRILKLGSEYEPLRDHIRELIVAEAKAYMRYNLYEQAKRLLETAREYSAEARRVRETLAELHLELDEREMAAREFLDLARTSAEDRERAIRYLEQARLHGGRSESVSVEEVAEELGIEHSELSTPELEKTGDWSSTESNLGDEETDPEQPSALFDDTSTATDLEPLSSSADVEGMPEEPEGLEEPTEVTVDGEEDQESGATPGRLALSDEGTYSALLDLLARVEETEALEEFRLVEPGGATLGRFWAHEGRLLPGIAVDGAMYGGEVEGEDNEFLDQIVDREPAEFASALVDLEGPWSPGELAPVQSVMARLFVRLLERARDQQLVVDKGVVDVSIDSPPSFSARSLVPSILEEWTDSDRGLPEAVFEAVAEEGFEAWLMAPGSYQGSDVWLPVRSTSMERHSVGTLAEIGRAVGELAETFAEMTDIDDEPSPEPVVSVLTSESTKTVLVQSPDRSIAIEVPRNRLGAVLKTVRSAVESHQVEAPREEESARPPEDSRPERDAENLRK